MSDKKKTPGVLSLVLVPAILSLLVSIARLVGQLVEGPVWLFGEAKPGAPSAVGIVWLIFVFGAWFGFRLRSAGVAPTRLLPAFWGLLAGIAAGVGLIVLSVQFGALVMPAPDTAPRGLHWFMLGLGTMVVGAVLAWPRLALTLLVYGYLARIPVIAITALCLSLEWDNTHYTQLPPVDIGDDFGERLLWSSMPQLTLWPAATVAIGSICGFLGAWLRGGAKK